MQAAPPALGQPFSLYLDLTRFAAAVVVVLAHISYFGVIPEGAWGLLPHMGREAVMVFFVLSGYVIASSTAQRRPSARAYAAARLSRVYSVALPILLLALAAAAAVRSFTDVVPPNAYVLDKLYVYLPLHLLFLGGHWTLAETPPYMLPYWSLGYEAWYYLLFGLACYLRGRRRILMLALALSFMGYKLWLLLPVWLAGAWLCRSYRAPWLGVHAARIGWLASVLLFGAWVGLHLEEQLRALGNAIWPYAALPLGSADRYLGDWLLCLIVLANFACARDAGFTALLRVARPVRNLASHTFTLYLSHALVIGLWQLFYPGRSTAGGILVLLAAIAATAIVLGAVTEGRRPAWRACFERLLAPRGVAADRSAA
ncbi:acyltransferase family protein [Massilia sp. IC2-477]|uniref:acyltransferase family protein n=1 Tax=Massilia sp. IC2-477 TaxID=2887198 RepID=UPI001D10BA76|nr:acyltransferase family protein [Massilia sp. IC2-477]MCC2958226.1 acyltransferase family protein [Massilia sp. IC2-477]